MTHFAKLGRGLKLVAIVLAGEAAEAPRLALDVSAFACVDRSGAGDERQCGQGLFQSSHHRKSPAQRVSGAAVAPAGAPEPLGIYPADGGGATAEAVPTPADGPDPEATAAASSVSDLPACAELAASLTPEEQVGQLFMLAVSTSGLERKLRLSVSRPSACAAAAR